MGYSGHVPLSTLWSDGEFLVLLDPCPENCVDCAFDTHEEPGWNFFSTIPAREFYAGRKLRLNSRNAVPFVSDFQTREIFETVATLDCL